MPFDLVAPYPPAGDQPRAIGELAQGLTRGDRYQTLLGVTGSGKTFTMAHALASFGRPTLVLSHNKTLAAQLYGELKGFFPRNAVEFFISYYDYYQPEAYVPQTDTYIAKDSSINDDIDRLRLRATSSLMERDDVIIVASVSAIYGLGDPEVYRRRLVTAVVGEERGRDELPEALGAVHRDRELFPPPHRAPGGRASRVPARLLPRRLPLHHRRVAPNDAAGRRDVRGGPLPQANPRGLRVPAALGARQPAAPDRRIHGPGAAHGVRVGHAGGRGAQALGGRRGGADHPSDRARGPRGRRASREGAG